MDHLLADGVLVDICLSLLPELDVAAASRSTQCSKKNSGSAQQPRSDTHRLNFSRNARDPTLTG